MTKYIGSDIHKRRFYFGTTLTRYHQNGEDHYQSDRVIDRPFIKTSTVVYLTFCALIFGYLFWQMIQAAAL